MNTSSIWTFYAVDTDSGQWIRLHSTHTFQPDDISLLLRIDPKSQPTLMYGQQLATQRQQRVHLAHNGEPFMTWEPVV